jgi:hypothetical protein
VPALVIQDMRHLPQALNQQSQPAVSFFKRALVVAGAAYAA